MIIDEIAATYSNALFSIPATDEVLEKRLSDLEEVSELLKLLPKFRHVLIAPQITKKEKEAILKKSLNDKSVDATILRFLFLLLEKDRFNCLPQIVKNYHRLVKDKLGILEVQLVTAIKMDKDFLDILKNKLEKKFSKKVEISEEIDSRIIGGAIIAINGQMMDFSIKTRLSKLKEKLRATSV